MRIAKQFWIVEPGRAEILSKDLVPRLDTEVLVAAAFGAVSRGTESLVFRGEVPVSQYEIMKATPTPEHCITVRFEDAILKQDETFAKVEDFLGFPLGKVIVRPDSVGRWKTDDGVHDFDFLHPAMKEYGYL